MAIPEDELARLGLSANSGETPEAAKQFWAGEELVHVGGGRFYPCRRGPLAMHSSYSVLVGIGDTHTAMSNLRPMSSLLKCHLATALCKDDVCSDRIASDQCTLQ